eukprot:gnl/TRDRNA2_/TRDRNA2_166533_c0_seq1.p1 gnl/TRDRNA2_/TRDRNA2_166533_c0~~gnl/TRDRNA2_/TRDRNA2_166533_c0_seq1.p1  ORF type:complete len:816 (+),score=146.27 gnl/TRDRNA2_/TRDRNA2_166533_c0_seq1:1-2448(+)
MDFAEVREWNRLYPRESAPLYKQPKHGRWALVNPELDARHFTLDELLKLSPECRALADTRAADAEVSAKAEAAAKNSRPVDIDGFERAEVAAKDGDVAKADASPMAAADAKDAPPGAVVGGMRDLPAEGQGTDDARRPTQTHDERPSDPSVDRGPFFVRRAPEQIEQGLFVRRGPEEYSRLESVESTLTSRLRRQASASQGRGDCGQSSMPGLSVPQGRATDKKIKFCVHLPPYHSKASVSIEVPMVMRVAGLRDEVVRQCGNKLGAGPFAAYELRLYDEDEEEPDYDCPPFDSCLQVGCLNVEDVAICLVGNSSETPPSQPSRSASVQEDGPPSNGTTPEAVAGRKVSFEGVLRKSSKERAEAPASPLDPILDESSGAGGQHDSSNSLEPCLPKAEKVADADEAQLDTPVNEAKPMRKLSDTQAVEPPVKKKFSHRRCRSSPSGPQVAAEPGQPLVTLGGFEALSAGEKAAQEVPAVRRPRSSSALFLFDKPGNAPLDKGGETCQLTLLLPEGGLLQAQLLRAASSSAVGAPAASGSGDVAGRHASSEEVVAPTNEPSGDSVVLCVSVEATLFEVLELLSQERGRACDPVTFAFERMEDGIRQRLDLHTQVKHLQPRSSVLTVVRKDAPVPLGSTDPFSSSSRREGLDDYRQLEGVRRPPPSAFFFNEYTASIAAEYFVTVAARGSRTRPVECTLVVDRERLYHQQPRGVAPQPERVSDQSKKAGFGLSPLLKKLGRHLQLNESSRVEIPIFVERRVCDIRSVTCNQGNQRSFSVVYSASGSEQRTIELVYEAQTPTDCAEIVARVQFLLTLVT